MMRQDCHILTSLQEEIVDVVCRYPGRFTRSGLAKMLVGAKSWQERELPEYGRFSSRRRKDVLYQVDILLQQGYMQLDSHGYLVPASLAERGSHLSCQCASDSISVVKRRR